MRPEDRAYCAGLFEGEGNINFHTERKDSGKSPYRNIGLDISMTDREPLDLFCDLMGFGKIYGPIDRGRTKLGTKRKSLYRYRVSGFERVQFVVCQLWFWLSPRRKEQIELAFSNFTSYRVRKYRSSWRTRH